MRAEEEVRKQKTTDKTVGGEEEESEEIQSKNYVKEEKM